MRAASAAMISAAGSSRPRFLGQRRIALYHIDLGLRKHCARGERSGARPRADIENCFDRAAGPLEAREGQSKLRHKSPACELLSTPPGKLQTDALRDKRRTSRPPRVSVRRKGPRRLALQSAGESQPASAPYYHAGTLRRSVVSELVRRASGLSSARSAQGALKYVRTRHA